MRLTSGQFMYWNSGSKEDKVPTSFCWSHLLSEETDVCEFARNYVLNPTTVNLSIGKTCLIQFSADLSIHKYAGVSTRVYCWLIVAMNSSMPRTENSSPMITSACVFIYIHVCLFCSCWRAHSCKRVRMRVRTGYLHAASVCC